MTRRLVHAALALLAGACQKPVASTAPAPLAAADADRIADATVAAWTSKDAARIKALYAPDIIGFNYLTGPLTTDRAEWDRAQDAYAAAGIDGADQQQRAIQVLGPDVMVMSGVWDLKSSAHPAYGGPVRCTEVFRKDAAGKWPIVNEHCAAVPRPA